MHGENKEHKILLVVSSKIHLFPTFILPRIQQFDEAIVHED